MSGSNHSNCIGNLRKQLQQGEFIQSISARNLSIAAALLELNRFDVLMDLREAKRGLKENIEIDSRKLQSSFLLVEVYLQQNKISEAKLQFNMAQEGLFTCC